MKTIASIFVISVILVLPDFVNQVEAVNFENQPSVAIAQGVPVIKNFRSHLTGDEEVPQRETLGVGEVIFQLNNDGTELSYKLIVAKLENVTAAHIHAAPVGVNGPVVVPLYTSGLLEGTTNGILAQGIITGSNLVGPLAGLEISDLIDLIINGGAYVNVHTSQYPGGEIRGQVF